MHTAMISIMLPKCFAEPATFHNTIFSRQDFDLMVEPGLAIKLYAKTFFRVKFKTLGLTVEPGLATKLCAKASSSGWQKLF